MLARVLLPIVIATLGVLVGCTSRSDAPAADGLQPVRTGSIAGRISQPDSTPETGAHVVAAVRHRDGSLMPVESTTAEWDGRYEIDDLPPGEYLVLAEPDPQAKVERLNRHVPPPVATLYPGVPRTEPGRPVRVFEGIATEGIDIWLEPAAQRYTVSGRVSWPDGVTVENITLEYGGEGDGSNGIWEVYDPGGLFTIEGLAAGTLVLLARAESSAGPLAGLVATEVGPFPVEEVRLPLKTPGSVSGRVVFTSTPSDPPGPVRLVHTLLDLSPLYPGAESPLAPDGSFAIPHALGIYALAVDNLPPGWRVVSLSRDGRRFSAGEITVGPGEAISGLEVMVTPP